MFTVDGLRHLLLLLPLLLLLLLLLGNAPLTIGEESCWVPSLASAPPQPLPPHPRLRLNSSALNTLNVTINSDATARSYFDGLVLEGVRMLDAPLVDCAPTADLLSAARTVLRQQYSLGLLWRLTGDTRFAERAAAELAHVTNNCTTWDPYGLVLSEMTHAVAIGFDWLHAFLTPAQRSGVVTGVAKLGLQEALAQFQQGVFWTK
jgi:hypothetical protein